MKRYRFRLEQVVRIKRLEEDQARYDLARCNAVLGRAREALSFEQARYAALSVHVGVMSADGLENEMAVGALRAATLLEAERRMDSSEALVRTARSVWVERHRGVAVLKRLDDRRRIEHDLDAQREEAAAIDDMVTARWRLRHSPRVRGEAEMP